MVLSVYAAAPAADRGRAGQPVQRPDDLAMEEFDPGIFIAFPTVEVTGEHRAMLRFETATIAPAARVFLGIYEPDGRAMTPRFREVAVEKTKIPGTKHLIELDLARLARPTIDAAGFGERGGGVVAYRVEVYDRHAAGSAFYEGRFAYRGDRRVPAIVAGPFVDLVGERGAVVSFDTDLPVTATLVLDGAARAAGGPRTRFEIALDDLEPGRAYTYAVAIGTEDFEDRTREFRFRTREAKSERLRFAILGDSREGVGGGERQYGGVNYRTLTRLLVDARARGAEFVIHSGDLVNGYTSNAAYFAAQLAMFKKAEETIGAEIPIYEAMGNHEITMDVYKDGSPGGIEFDKTGEKSSEAIFAAAFVNPLNAPAPAAAGAPPYTENVYYFDQGPARFVVMNNNYWYVSQAEKYGGNLEGYVLDDQLAWLRRVFDEAAKSKRVKHVFLIAQEPMFPTGGHTADAMWYGGGDPEQNAGVDRRYVIERRDEIWEAFIGTGKAAAANFGDEHNYSRMRVTDALNPDFKTPAWQIISGGAGAPFYAKDPNVPWADRVEKFSTRMHYTLFDVDGDTVRLRVYDVNGELIEDVRLK
ncbi:MAG: metallophosphoesterase [Deltaproteobacteria bacterium]|nr:metallophosphoesterase [Deltaproteobacteria bacterium]